MIRFARYPSPRRLLVFVAPLVVWVCWLTAMAHGDRWHLFATCWHMSIVMMIGSFVAGATSEGGGAVAFPAMTLIFDVAPSVARDFSVMIQTIGMNSAALTIFFLRIPVETRAVCFAGLGGAIGVILGLEFVELPASFAKMLFVSTWLAFAMALGWVNRYREREVMLRIEQFRLRHAVMLTATGVVGGVVTSITGSGLDICTFALLVLRLRICEKIATPTSVVLMGVNSAIAFAYKGTFIAGGLSAEAWRYWWVCVPVVTCGAPFGAWFIKNRSRHFVARLLYFSIGMQTLWAVIVLRVYEDILLASFSVAVFVSGSLFFWYMARRGVRRLEWLAEQDPGPAPA